MPKNRNKTGWRKGDVVKNGVNWSLAGRRAAAHRGTGKRRPDGIVGFRRRPRKTKPKQHRTSRKPSHRVVKVSRRKGKIPTGFRKYTVNKTKLIAKLQAQKQTSFKPTEVVSLTWDVIRGHKKR